ncbi:hypothetical protein IU433_31210 [Nocardia puris]|uniref:hypothetical protein n=1 Tax=Nocardia puris TaxID=208602 RepID=UPI001893A9F7|nr:hypothetical protein [Nocardia puris]MBF6215337.1 hypothetical protein [Nocardia puris]MBF6369809.1 hypothetical protein [Nocardia puris]MBF6463468.1 hypothetical protein [Nocardia puris]
MRWTMVPTKLTRLTVRAAVIGALAAGAVVAVPQVAMADAKCPNGTARVFLYASTNHCQGGTQTYTNPTVVKVCSMSRTKVVIETKGERRINNRTVELGPGHCAAFEPRGQESATVAVSAT